VRFVADEGVDRQIVDRLRGEGHQVFAVAEAEAGMTDGEVLQLAVRGEAVLITTDKDFGELVFRLHQSSNGVLLLRLSELPRGKEVQTAVTAVREHGERLLGAFSVVTPGRVRVRSENPE
jgi:predicted nuclease of predicted toxin-antitoxin system